MDDSPISEAGSWLTYDAAYTDHSRLGDKVGAAEEARQAADCARAALGDEADEVRKYAAVLQAAARSAPLSARSSAKKGGKKNRGRQ